MNSNIILGSIFASIAWIILILSFWKNKDDGILWLQILANILFMVNYIVLGAYTGLFVILFEILRDIAYIKHTEDRKIFFLSIPIYIVIGIFSYDGIMCLCSILASLNDGYSLAHKGKKLVGFGIITYILWLIYDLYYGSYVNILAEGIVIISNIIILINEKNIFNKKSL